MISRTPDFFIDTLCDHGLILRGAYVSDCDSLRDRAALTSCEGTVHFEHDAAADPYYRSFGPRMSAVLRLLVHGEIA